MVAGAPASAVRGDGGESDGGESDGAESEAAWSLEGGLTLEGLVNVRGGLDRAGGWLANLDLTAELDCAAAGWWEGTTAFLYVLANTGSGSTPSEAVGDLQATSNIEAPETAKLYEAWIEHRFAGDRVALLAGLHDYNGDFYALDAAGLFRNSSFGIGPDVSQTGPSIFPTTALGLRLAVDTPSGWYGRWAVYDGVPGDPGDERGTQIVLDDDDGLFWAAEVGRRGAGRKAGLGLWFHTAELEGPSGATFDDNAGIYVLAETPLATTASGGRWSGFVQLGAARRDRNAVSAYAGVGCVLTAPHPARPEDAVGLAVGHARLGDAPRAAQPGLAAAETAAELSYAAWLGPRVTLQPSVQYIRHPSAEPALDDALQLGLTVFVSF